MAKSISNSRQGDSVVVIGLGRWRQRGAFAGGGRPEVLAMDASEEVVQDLAHELPHVVKADRPTWWR